jgi:hypothetical protein
MVVAILNIVVGLLLAFGGAQEAILGGFLGGDTAGLAVGGMGTVSSLLLTASGFALWRRWRHSRELTLVACGLVAGFCVLAALPPYRFVGILALLIGVVYTGFVVVYLCRTGQRGPSPGPAGTPGSCESLGEQTAEAK